ncbi:pseudouridine synthase, RluA family protein [Francisella philomiragia subsp. philomiragia ATCC 25015]|uniref:RluA family pseudouridine synthase n=1 Tax=Francisella philomiragia TaxID=28110 RepID=UPI0001AF7882|nr:RluA family pseudouridine synthase [Francisella philomiragia]AJI75571.1 pseudouridine synthase, RluA family protein [Francisella philomiragia subsp. philomiragia ATCC 25015]EET20718.1 ribosomal large subunit pseudouridine synthase C [Francisella philomiragia subsp. philomiragia ATCC 25015]MBK2238394.1 RluA family pseudouridine synthase [Francisella philomiragia]QUE31232.1 RluA family pseudouridine synthase [Francisella philomiragia]
MNKVQLIEVTDDVIEQRIDNFLISKFSRLPKSLIYRWIRKGELRVNKKRVKQTTRVSAGDIVRVPPFSLEENLEIAKVSKSHLDFLEQRILYETDDYIVVDKPSGMAVHGGSGVNSGLVERLRQLRPKVRRLDLVHRLDKETSGCVLLAKKHSSLVYFFDIFKERKVNKIYYALVHGHWDEKVDAIDLPLSRTETKDGQRIVKVDKREGKRALTRILAVQKIGDYSLLEIKLETGRTHQIRVHTRAMGHPIVADKKYGYMIDDEKLLAKGVDKLLLHAGKLEFYDEKQQKLISIEAKLDSRFDEFVKTE